MLTEKDYCDYETCVALKELGYPEHEIVTYDFNLLLYEAHKWLREEKGLFIEISIFLGKYDLEICNTKVESNNTHKLLWEICGFETYEEALSEGLRTAVKILKEK